MYPHRRLLDAMIVRPVVFLAALSIEVLGAYLRRAVRYFFG